MITRVYRLTGPKRFETILQEVSLEKNENVLVRPDYLSICAADERYYLGLRKKEILQKKLPLALIHEAIGRIVYDPQGGFSVGEPVVLIPNQPWKGPLEAKENYDRRSVFLSSGGDGFMQEMLSIPRSCVLSLPDRGKYVYVLSELLSVAINAVDNLQRELIPGNSIFGLWGDGNVSFVTALTLKVKYPEARILIFGINESKLRMFSFADRCFLTEHIPAGLQVDHCFECVGGQASGRAIEQMIGLIRPQGTISLMGVSEDPVGINTRMVLEKGLKLFGNSRSGKEDFEQAISIIHQREAIRGYLETMISEIVEVRELSHIYHAFEQDQLNDFKTVMKWEI